MPNLALVSADAGYRNRANGEEGTTDLKRGTSTAVPRKELVAEVAAGDFTLGGADVV